MENTMMTICSQQKWRSPFQTSHVQKISTLECIQKLKTLKITSKCRQRKTRLLLPFFARTPFRREQNGTDVSGMSHKCRFTCFYNGLREQEGGKRENEKAFQFLLPPPCQEPPRLEWLMHAKRAPCSCSAMVGKQKKPQTCCLHCIFLVSLCNIWQIT